MTLKNNRAPLYTASSFVHHFIAIIEFKLELQSGNAQFGSKSAIFVPCDLEISWMPSKNNRAGLGSIPVFQFNSNSFTSNSFTFNSNSNSFGMKNSNSNSFLSIPIPIPFYQFLFINSFLSRTKSHRHLS